MKKVISLFLIFALVALTSMSFFACGGNKTGGSDTSGDGSSVSDTSGAGTTVGATESNTEPAATEIDLQTKVDPSTVNGTAGVTDAEQAVNIFDGDTATKWCALQDTLSVEWKMTEPVTVNYYYFTTANDSPERNPDSWILSGSADGAAWTELSKVEGANMTKEFFTDSDKYTVDKPQSFQYYKLEITAIAVPGTNVAQFSEFKFFQAPGK